MPEKGRRKITGFRLWSEALFAYLILCPKYRIECSFVGKSFIERMCGIIYYIESRFWVGEKNVYAGHKAGIMDTAYQPLNIEMETYNVYHSRTWKSRQGVSQYKT